MIANGVSRAVPQHSQFTTNLLSTHLGHDFRKAFKDLKFFKEEFPTVPMICCTATATSRVRQDIIDTLKLNPRTLKSFTMTTARPNLHYEVRYTSYSEDRYSDDLLPWLRAIHARRRDNPTRAAELSHAGERPTNISGIIYTLTRAETETLAARLTADGIGAKPYHAGLTLQARAAHLAGWVADSPGFDVMVATTAFGMGIDKGNVRFVVHWSLPKSFEGFYQEAGRAGRDGKASVCRLYYAREDRDRGVAMFTREMQKGLHARGGGAGGGGAAAAAAGGEKMRQSVEMRGKSLQALIAYCENVGACRHALIAKYFGEGEGDASLAPPSVKCEWACDWHKDPEMLKRRKELGLADEEWCATQRETGAYGEYDEYD
jgi:bloom syndrome protein